MTYSGTVIGGSRRAASLGFPTANIALADALPSGVYIASVAIEGVEYPAVAFADQGRKLLEAHILDFADDLYGKEISISLIKRLRDAAYFDDEANLKEAIAADVAAARAHFSA